MALGLYWATVCLCIFLAVLALDIMGFFTRKNHFEVDGRVSYRSREEPGFHMIAYFLNRLLL